MEKKIKNLSSSSKEMILLQTAEVYVVNGRNNKQIKLKVLFDSGSEKSFLSKRAYTCLQLSTICTENLKINTSGNENSQNSLSKKVRFQLKRAKNKSIETKAYVTPVNSIPPLELLGNLLLNRLIVSVKIALKKELKIGKSYYWTDSKIHFRG